MCRQGRAGELSKAVIALDKGVWAAVLKVVEAVLLGDDHLLAAEGAAFLLFMSGHVVGFAEILDAHLLAAGVAPDVDFCDQVLKDTVLPHGYGTFAFLGAGPAIRVASIALLLID